MQHLFRWKLLDILQPDQIKTEHDCANPFKTVRRFQIYEEKQQQSEVLL